MIMMIRRLNLGFVMIKMPCSDSLSSQEPVHRLVFVLTFLIEV